jgi:phosphorylcholine metabolism protein LicD
LGVETWIAHGSLLGWWWNKKVFHILFTCGTERKLTLTKILPWDSDIDVQVSAPSMHFLASYYNMTVFHYSTPRIPSRDYLLEINPHYSNGSRTDKLNVIDARWVDTESGLFIDITTVHPVEKREGWLECKDGHTFKDDDIFPLRTSTYEGVTAKVPNKFEEVLVAEYGRKSLTQTKFSK